MNSLLDQKKNYQQALLPLGDNVLRCPCFFAFPVPSAGSIYAHANTYLFAVGLAT